MSSARAWITRWMGRSAWDGLWGPLLRGKFGARADDIAMVWLWSKLRLRRSVRGEEAKEERPPQPVPRAPAHPARDPRARRDVLERRRVAREELDREHDGAEPDARERRQRAEAQEVLRRDERVQRAVGVERDRARVPLDRVRHPELRVERGDVAVGSEEVVVVALEQRPVGERERRGLPAEAGPALVDLDLVPGAGQPVGGGQPAHARAEDRDPHRCSARSGSASASGAVTFTRSRTT